MFSKCVQRLKASDFNKIEGNKLCIEEEKEFVNNESMINLDTLVEGKMYKKYLYACRANAERLPF